MIVSSAIGKFLSMFGITWVPESTFSTINFWNLNAEQLFPIQIYYSPSPKIYHPNGDVCEYKITLTPDFKDLVWKKVKYLF